MPAARRSMTSRSNAETKRARFRTAFGTALSAQLAQHQQTQADLARRLSRSASYLNQVMSGRKPASAEWVELVADALELAAMERHGLHAAAARDRGYKLDLTLPPRRRLEKSTGSIKRD
jgi:transcriptional regulator with XRE-family HTH domain